MLLASNSGGANTKQLSPVEVFSTYLYIGNGSTQTIENGIDLAGEGGLVWTKNRTPSAQDHCVYDTVRGVGNVLTPNAVYPASPVNWQSSFNDTGFTVGMGGSNSSAYQYASWTFRRAPKFFDVVQYTGNGVAGREIPHNLGCEPGMVVVKRTDSTSDWIVWHRSIANTEFMKLNGADAKATGAYLSNTTPTSTVITIGGDASINASGGTYIMYLFGHEE